MTKYKENLLPNTYYHIYNRTNNKEAMFRSAENRRYFLKKYADYLYPYLKTYAYCLMDNHFHLLVQVRSEKEIVQAIQAKSLDERKKIEITYLKISEDVTGFQNLSRLTSHSFTHNLVAKLFQDFFNSYTKAFNKMYERSGNLFNRPFKRVAVKDDSHFTQLIYYIHANPCHHKVRHSFKAYKWSSYTSFLSDKPTLLDRQAVISWFGQLKSFVAFHDRPQDFGEIDYILVEE
ncbi:MAG: transposase [Chitinophagales bacterium]